MIDRTLPRRDSPRMTLPARAGERRLESCEFPDTAANVEDANDAARPAHVAGIGNPGFFPVGVLAQADPLAPKPARETPLRVGDRVVIPFGTEPRASKDADDDLKLHPPAPGDQRNAFRVYRIEKLEPEWLWIQAEHDGTAGWITRDDATPIEKAFERATNEILANPENPSVFINRALLWAEKGELDLAIADYDAAIRLDPGSPTAFNNRGTLWRRKKNTDRAVADFTEAIRLDPLYAAAYNNRGITWRFQDLDRAIADYSEAIRIDPSYFIAYNNRGNSYREKKEFDRAIADFTEAIRIQPRYAFAYANRGMVYRVKNDYQRALDDYTEAIHLDPKHSVAAEQSGMALGCLPRPEVSRRRPRRGIGDASL